MKGGERFPARTRKGERPKKNLSPWLSLWEAYPHGRRVLQIVGVGEQLCNYYKVQYVEDGSCNGGD